MCVTNITSDGTSTSVDFDSMFTCISVLIVGEDPLRLQRDPRTWL